MHFQLNKISLSMILGYNLIAPQLSFATTLTPTQTELSFTYSLSGLGISKTGTGAVNESAGYPGATTFYGVLPSVTVFNNGTDVSVEAVAGGNTAGWGRVGDSYGSIPVIPFSDAQATSTFHAVYTNNGAVADNFDFNFNIKSGFLQLFDVSPVESATFLGQILINDVLVWSSTASLSRDTAYSGYEGVSFISAGVDLGYQQDTSSQYQSLYTFGNYNGSVNLGTLNTNESVDVKYILSTSATTDGFYWYGGAIANVNDPFGASSGNSIPTISVTSTSPVPEPETLAMISVGLGLMAARIRNRTNKRKQ